MSNKQKHRWYDVIVAWANGEEIQYKLPASKEWVTYNKHRYVSTGFESSQPDFSDNDYEWRIKPKTVTKKYRMALVKPNQWQGDVIVLDVTNSSIDDHIEYNIREFIRWVGDTTEVEIEVEIEV